MGNLSLGNRFYTVFIWKMRWRDRLDFNGIKLVYWGNKGPQSFHGMTVEHTQSLWHRCTQTWVATRKFLGFWVFFFWYFVCFCFFEVWLGAGWVAFHTWTYCFWRWSWTVRLGLSHSLWLDAVTRYSLAQFLMTWGDYPTPCQTSLQDETGPQ